MEALRLVLTGRPGPAPLVTGHLGEALYTARAIFGRETIELRDVADARYAGILAIKEYPATTRPGLWDALLTAPFGFVSTQSFAFLSKPAARTVMERKQNQMVSARDRAALEPFSGREAVRARSASARRPAGLANQPLSGATTRAPPRAAGEIGAATASRISSGAAGACVERRASAPTVSAKARAPAKVQTRVPRFFSINKGYRTSARRKRAFGPKACGSSSDNYGY